LGWIPDYPDLRNYNLRDQESIKNDLSLKIEGITSDLEKIVEDLINSISDLIAENNLQKQRIKEFKNQILSNVLFAKVKVHKLLGEITRTSGIIDKQYLFNPIKYESILANQIVDLKKYLGILLMRGYLSQLPIKNGTNYVHSNDAGAVVRCMREQEYDITNKSLVKNF
jgi:hypothetical protein